MEGGVVFSCLGLPTLRLTSPYTLNSLKLEQRGLASHYKHCPKALPTFPEAKITKQLRNTNISIGNRVVFLGPEAKAGQGTEIPALWEGEEKGLVPLLSTYLVAGTG